MGNNAVTATKMSHCLVPVNKTFEITGTKCKMLKSAVRRWRLRPCGLSRSQTDNVCSHPPSPHPPPSLLCLPHQHHPSGQYETSGRAEGWNWRDGAVTGPCNRTIEECAGVDTHTHTHTLTYAQAYACTLTHVHSGIFVCCMWKWWAFDLRYLDHRAPTSPLH